MYHKLSQQLVPLRWSLTPIRHHLTTHVFKVRIEGQGFDAIKFKVPT